MAGLHDDTPGALGATPEVHTTQRQNVLAARFGKGGLRRRTGRRGDGAALQHHRPVQFVGDRDGAFRPVRFVDQTLIQSQPITQRRRIRRGLIAEVQQGIAGRLG